MTKQRLVRRTECASMPNGKRILAKAVLKISGGILTGFFGLALFEPALHYYGTQETLNLFQQLCPLIIFVTPPLGGIVLIVWGTSDISHQLKGLNHDAL